LNYRFYVSVPKFFEGLIHNELESLGCKELKPSGTGVYFEGSLRDAYRVILWSRLANRVLLPLANDMVTGSDELYESVMNIPWEDHLNEDTTIVVDVSSTPRGETKTGLTHSRFAAQRVKDGIVDRMKEKCGIRPSVDREDPDLRIHLAITNNGIQVSLDLGGGSLHQRGYRSYLGQAPLKENLAAGILMRVGWSGTEDSWLVDPMCGSGTLLIEGAMIALNMAPGLLRECRAMKGWRGFPEETYSELKVEAQSLQHETGTEPRFFGFDHDKRVLEAAYESARICGLEGVIKFEHRDLTNWSEEDARFFNQSGKTGLVVVNPPYGERMGSLPGLSELYRKTGSVFRESFPDWEAAVFTGNIGLAHRLGIRAHGKYGFRNGPIECQLLKFRIPQQSNLEQPQLTASEEMFFNRLGKNHKKLKKWLKREEISCYRLYDADMPEYNAAVDVYENQAVCYEYAVPKTIDPAKAEKRRFEMLHVISVFLGIDSNSLFYKVRQRLKRNKQVQRDSESEQMTVISESGLSFFVNLTDYLDTGIFLDSRLIRRMIRERSQGKDVLNLFGYTGTASVYAAAGGAKTVTTVDLSYRYLDWAKKNMNLNGYQERKHRYIDSDVFEFLKEDQGKYDLIYLDPPSFSNSKKFQGSIDIQRDHVALISLAMSKLRTNGSLIFSCNLRDFQLSEEEMSHRRFQWEDISRKTIPMDYERKKNIHKCIIFSWN